jgi:predicted nucleotidyltransferase
MSNYPPPEMKENRLPGMVAARAFVAEQFADCLAAIISGSVARGDARGTSDLDILIVTDAVADPYRETFQSRGWVIEAFIETRSSVAERLRRVNKSRSPSFLRFCAEGLVLVKHKGLAQYLIDTAQATLQQGPAPLTSAETRRYRYIITEWLDDFADAESFEEALFMVYELTSKASELLLGLERCWIGERRWLYKALKQSANPLADQLILGLKDYYQNGQSKQLIETVEVILELAGGRLYEGFSDSPAH